jgi:hypothetical protein
MIRDTKEHFMGATAGGSNFPNPGVAGTRLGNDDMLQGAGSMLAGESQDHRSITGVGTSLK